MSGALNWHICSQRSHESSGLTPRKQDRQRPSGLLRRIRRRPDSVIRREKAENAQLQGSSRVAKGAAVRPDTGVQDLHENRWQYDLGGDCFLGRDELLHRQGDDPEMHLALRDHLSCWMQVPVVQSAIHQETRRQSPCSSRERSLPPTPPIRVECRHDAHLSPHPCCSAPPPLRSTGPVLGAPEAEELSASTSRTCDGV